MRFRPSSAIAGTAALCFVALLLAWGRFKAADQSASSARARLSRVSANVIELETLRAELPPVMPSDKPHGFLVTHLRESLQRADLAGVQIKQITRPGDRVAQRPGTSGDNALVSLRSEVIVLESLTTSELGQWLQDWRQHHAEWTPSQISMNAIRGRTQLSGGYSVTIHMTTLFSNHQPPGLNP